MELSHPKLVVYYIIAVLAVITGLLFAADYYVTHYRKRRRLPYIMPSEHKSHRLVQLDIGLMPTNPVGFKYDSTFSAATASTSDEDSTNEETPF